LGAGFSSAINPQMPTTKDLTIMISKTAAQYGLNLPAPLKNAQSNGKELDENIELWMTYLSQDQPWLDAHHNLQNKATAAQLRRRIRAIIEDCTNQTTTSPPPSWLITLIKQWHKHNAAVITLNYDTLVERATMMNSLSLGAGHLYPPYLSNIRSRVEAPSHSTLIDTFKYYKLHGSVNWHYSGREIFYGETIYYSDVSRWGILGEDEQESRLYTMDKETLLIPPVTEKTTFFNNETVRQLWQQSSSVLGSARRVFVIGYSLPLSDLGMCFFLTHSQPILGTNWYVVNKDKSAASRFSELLAPQQVICDDFVGGCDSVARFVEEYLSMV